MFRFQLSRVWHGHPQGVSHRYDGEAVTRRLGPATHERVGTHHGAEPAAPPRVIAEIHGLGSDDCFAGSGHGLALHRHVPTHLLHNQRHLVGDEADVCRRVGQHREAASLAGGGHEQEGLVHLDDGLVHLAAAEVDRAALGEALNAGGKGRQVLRVLTAEPGRGAQREAVAGQHGGLLHVDHAPGQVVDEPVEMAVGHRGALQRLLGGMHVHWLSPSCGKSGLVGSAGGWCGLAWPCFPPFSDRPSRQPCRKADITLRAFSGERGLATGAASGCRAAESLSWGARLICRTRCGRPFSVSPLCAPTGCASGCKSSGAVTSEGDGAPAFVPFPLDGTAAGGRGTVPGQATAGGTVTSLATGGGTVTSRAAAGGAVTSRTSRPGAGGATTSRIGGRGMVPSRAGGASRTAAPSPGTTRASGIRTTASTPP